MVHISAKNKGLSYRMVKTSNPKPNIAAVGLTPDDGIKIVF